MSDSTQNNLVNKQFINKCFTMTRLNGPFRPIGTLVPCLQFRKDGTAYGSQHPNEGRWEVPGNGDVILLRHCDGHVTTRFERKSERHWAGLLEGTEIKHELWRYEPICKDKTKLELVVAHYNEQIYWADDFYGLCTVYNKGAPDPKHPEWIKLKNIGREAHTYLTHIVRNYDNLADKTIFLQGYPYDHLIAPWIEYEDMSRGFYSNAHGIVHFDGREPHIWTATGNVGTPMSNWWISENLMYTFLREVLEIDYKQRLLHYTYGAQFSVSRDRIREKPLSYYEKLLDFVSQYPTFTLGGETWENYLIGVLFEWTWHLIFQ